MVIRENLKESLDELAITKAAAWAWYERGSWFEHKSIRESDCRRKGDYTPKPSRYKLEAMKNPQNETDHETQRCTKDSLLCTEHVGNSLFDTYEIERISRELDCYIQSSGVKHQRKSVDGGVKHRRKSVDDGVKHRRKSVDGGGGVVYLPEDTVGKRESKSKTDKRKGFWSFWIRGPIVCGSNRDDVVKSNFLIGGSRRQKEPVLDAGIINIRRPIIHDLIIR